MKRFFLSVLIGIPISYIALCICIGSIADAGAFFAMSIICTAGISLIVWIPVWWVLGIGPLILISKRLNQGSPKPPALPRKILPVVNYLHDVRASGDDEAEAERHLQSVGWSAEQIAEGKAILDRKKPQ